MVGFRFLQWYGLRPIVTGRNIRILLYALEKLAIIGYNRHNTVHSDRNLLLNEKTA